MVTLALVLMGLTAIGWGFAIFAAPTAPHLLRIPLATTCGLFAAGISVVISGLTSNHDVRYFVIAVMALVSAALTWGERKSQSAERTPWGLIATIVAALVPMTLNARAAAVGLPAQWDGWRTFYQDHFAQIAWVGETVDRAPSDYPWVAGVELHYTWLFHASMGFLSDISGLSADVILSQIWPYIYTVLFTSLFGWLVWKISQERLPAVFFAFILVIGFNSPLGLASMRAVQPIAAVSPTRDFGNLLILVALIALLEWINRWAKANVPQRLGFALLMATLGFTGHASKGSALIVLIGAIGFMWLISMIVSKKNSIALFVATVSVSLGAAAAQLLVVKSSHYLTVDPMTFIGGDTKLWKLATIILVAIAAQIVFIAIGTSQTSQTQQLAMSAILGASISGTLGLAIFGHPGTSQRYFYYNAYPLIAAGLGICVVILAGKFGKRIYVWAIAVLAASWNFARLNPVTKFEDNLSSHVVQVVIGTLALGWLLLAALTLFKWRSTHLKQFLMIAFASSIAFNGIVSLSTYKFSEPSKASNIRAISSAQVEALRFIRDNSSPTDIVASNRQCRSGSIATGDCYPIWFPVSAYSERRVLVEGFSYTWKTSGEALEDKFWDAKLLKLNNSFFSSPTKSNCTQMVERGVRWVFVDRRFKGGNLEQIGEKKFENSDASVFEITSCN